MHFLSPGEASHRYDVNESMSTQPPTTPTSGRVIRAALIILPFGTVLLGILSFVLFFDKKEQTVQRSIKYASGLRKDLNEADLKRYEKIVADTLALPPAERTHTLATFLDSTLGPENMGYQVRTFIDRGDPKAAPLALDVELTGNKRPRDLVVVICGFAPDATFTTGLDQETPRGVAALLGVAHATTGMPRVRSLRYTAVQNLAALKSYYEEGIQVGERITHLILLGSIAQSSDAEVMTQMHLEGRGVTPLRPNVKGDVLTSAQELLKIVGDLGDRP